MVVSTRYLGPGDFGQLVVAIVFVSVFGFFTDAGLYTVAARELAKHPEDERTGSETRWRRVVGRQGLGRVLQ